MASAFAAEQLPVALALALTLVAAGCDSDSVAPIRNDASVPPSEAGINDASPPTAKEAGEAAVGVTPAPDDSPYTTLAEWHLFTDPVKQLPAPGVVPYEVISQLFADYASKRRFIYVPPGTKIGYSDADEWRFPVGAILVKTFSYLADTRDATKGETLLETRLLIHQADGWVADTYRWNAEQTEATLSLGGAVVDSTFIDASGETVKNGYKIPSGSDCLTCHGKLGDTDTLGAKTRQLNRDHDYGSGPENQIDHFAKLGLLEKGPEAGAREMLVDPFGAAPIFERVRSYFDGNCAQCHKPGDSPGSLSGLWLDYASTAEDQPRVNWGFCKMPASAGGGTCGHQFDVVPGAPDDSILICRLESQLAKVKMPPLGRNLIHTEAVQLMRDWTTVAPGKCGAAPVPEKDAGGDAAITDAAKSDAATDR
jgi:uncharacterized repeat protein (TIGR03806 family)